MSDHNGSFIFQDRIEAGAILANRLKSYAEMADVVVLALPRGGVPVGAEIARALNSPLGVFIARKLGVPGHKELAMGAITSGGSPIIDPAVTSKLHLGERLVQTVVRRETQRLKRTEELYCKGQKPADLKDKIVILADDGATTGATLALAIQTIRQEGAAEVIVAVPVATHSAVSLLSKTADEVVCLMQPKKFVNEGHWYEEFGRLTDRQVCQILERAGAEEARAKSA